jgi:HEPN domain-containing protein
MARIIKSYDTVETFKGDKIVNKKVGISVLLIAKNEKEYETIIEKLNSLDIEEARCPFGENNEYGDQIAYFNILDKEEAEDFIKEAKRIIRH